MIIADQDFGSSAPAKVWVLADDNPGHSNQALGLARKLGLPFEVKKMSFNKLSGLPPILQPAGLYGLNDISRRQLVAPWPELVIAAGRRTVPVARWLARQNSNIRLVQIMDPRVHRDEFDLIVAPAHDAGCDGSNCITTVGALNNLTHEMLSEAASIWKPVFEKLPEPRIALMVGGAVGHGRFTVENAKLLGEAANRMAERVSGSLLVSTSRRTGSAQAAAIKQAITVPNYWHEWPYGDENPYLGYLAVADAIVVTGDSVSMLSDACFTGVPVYVAAMSDLPEKHRRFQVQLVEKRLVRPFTGGYFVYEYEPLDEASRVAAEIKTRFKNLFD